MKKCVLVVSRAKSRELSPKARRLLRELPPLADLVNRSADLASKGIVPLEKAEKKQELTIQKLERKAAKLKEAAPNLELFVELKDAL